MCGILAILFLLVPVVEISVILKVGSLLGLWLTLAIIVVTALAGAALAKSQGLAVLRQLSEAVASGGTGAGTSIVEGVLILSAGMMLLTPGFVTDTIGLSLLFPPVRKALASRLAGHWKLRGIGTVEIGSAFNGRGAGFADDSEDPPGPGVIDV